MSRPALSVPPIIAFIDPAQEIWGVAVGDQPAKVTVGSLGSEPAETAAFLTSQGDLGQWSLSTADGQLRLTSSPISDGARAGEEALAMSQTEGVLALQSDTTTELHGGGMRHPGGGHDKLESARALIAWFPEERAMALLARRSRGAKGQDRDTLTVACLGVAGGTQVFDPRLSSTYGGDGGIRRVGAELWLGETEDGDQVPFRVAGEALGAGSRVSEAGVAIRAQPLRCHSRGQDGVGIYLLIRGDE